MAYEEFSGDSDDEYTCGDVQRVNRCVDEQLFEEEEDNEDDVSDNCDLVAGGHDGDVGAAGVSIDDGTCPELPFSYEYILDANMEYPPSLISDELKNRLYIPDPFTEMQEAVNRIVSGVDDSDFEKWGKFLWYKIDLLYNRHCKKASNSKQSNIIIHGFINVFPQSVAFERSVIATFKIPEIDEAHVFFNQKPLNVPQLGPPSAFSPLQLRTKRDTWEEWVCGVSFTIQLSIYVKMSV